MRHIIYCYMTLEKLPDFIEGFRINKYRLASRAGFCHGTVNCPSDRRLSRSSAQWLAFLAFMGASLEPRHGCGCGCGYGCPVSDEACIISMVGV